MRNSPTLRPATWPIVKMLKAERVDHLVMR